MAKSQKPQSPPKPDVQLPATRAWYERSRLIGGLLAALAFLLYANTLGHQYALDDAIVITDNMFTQKGISGIPGILQYDTFYGFFKEAGKANLVSGGRYRPLSLVTFALEWSIAGKNPFLSHLVNVLLFALSCTLLYTLLLRLFQSAAGAARYIVPLLATLLFAVHPIHTEVVANIKGRDEILTLLLSMLALWAVLQGFDKGRAIWAWLGGLSLFLALLAKENAITWLAVIPLALYIFRKAGRREQLKLNLPLWAGAVLFLAIRGAVLGWSLGGDPPMELMNNPFLKWTGHQYLAFSASEKMATILFTVGKYLQLLFFPHPLTHDYYPQVVTLHSFAEAGTAIMLLGCLLLLAYGIYAAVRRQAIGFAILYFLLTFSIVSNVFFPIGTFMGERFMYMPSLGFCLAIACLLGRIAAAPLSLGLGALLCIPLAGKTMVRNPAWADDLTLFRSDIGTSAKSAKLNNALAGSLMTSAATEQDPAVKNSQLLEAKNFALNAQQLHPTYKYPPFILGNVYYYLQQYDSAAINYQLALLIEPTFAEANKNLGLSLRDAGRVAGEKEGNLPKALELLAKAEKILGPDYETYRLQGIAMAMSGKSREAIPYFQKAAELSPQIADAWQNLATAYHGAGQEKQAQEALAKAAALRSQQAAQ